MTPDRNSSRMDSIIYSLCRCRLIGIPQIGLPRGGGVRAIGLSAAATVRAARVSAQRLRRREDAQRRPACRRARHRARACRPTERRMSQQCDQLSHASCIILQIQGNMCMLNKIKCTFNAPCAVR